MYTAEQISDAENFTRLLVSIPTEKRRFVCKEIKRFMEKEGGSVYGANNQTSNHAND